MKTLILVMAMLTSPLAVADKVGQGAGMSENNIIFGYQNLGSYLRLCLALKDCLDTEAQVTALTNILNILPEEYAQPTPISFKSQAHDGIFFIDGKVRVALTWGYVGAPIFFNVDQLYQRDSSGRIEGISLPTAVRLLVHELGHHLGHTNHDWLDSLGGRVARVLASRVSSGILSPERDTFQWTSIHLDYDRARAQYSQLALSDGPNLYDLSQEIFTRFHCPVVKGLSSSLVGLNLWNFSWRSIHSSTPVLVGYAKPYCRTNPPGQPQVWSPRGFGVQIRTVITTGQEHKLIFAPQGFSVRQVTCVDEPLMCDWEKANAGRLKWISSLETIRNKSHSTTHKENRP